MKGVPEGSFKWDSVAKSSAVSSNGGLRSGGRVSLASLISLRFVLISTSCAKHPGFGKLLASKKEPYLSSFVYQSDASLISVLRDINNFSRYPSKLLVCTPMVKAA
jgi:hypothetical protein